jgi:Protein of unknown function, DUF547
MTKRAVRRWVSSALFALASTLSSAAGAQDAGVARGDPYAGYESLLRAVVRGDGVDYRALRGRIAELRAFCQWLADNGPTATPAAFATADARLSYWLNAYNATVLRAIAESPESMRNVLESQPNSGFFRARTHRVDRRSLTLDAIENREVRERFRDPRVHSALNCGARSCPPLSSQAFRPRTVSSQLDRLASAWVNGAAVTVDARARALRVSALFQWFAEDFSGTIRGRPVEGVTGPMRFVLAFASRARRDAIVTVCGPTLAQCRVEHVPYDWALNSAR